MYNYLSKNGADLILKKHRISLISDDLVKTKYESILLEKDSVLKIVLNIK